MPKKSKPRTNDPLAFRTDFDRRRFLADLVLGGACLSLHPLQLLYKSMVNNVMLQSAKAQLGNQVKNLLVIALPGAPPLWQLLALLRPNGTSDNFVRNPSVNNWIPGDAYTGNNADVSYEIEPIAYPGGNLYASPLWNRRIPISSGGWVPINSLLNNVMIANASMSLDQGHVLGPARITRPNPSARSLTGIVADLSTRPIPAVGHSGVGYDSGLGDPRYGGFSANQSAIAMIRGSDPLTQLMSAFVNTDPNVVQNNARLGRFIQNFRGQAVDSLRNLASTIKPGSEILYQNLIGAQDMFSASFGNLLTTYNTLANKYRSLERLCATDPIANMIPATGTIGNYNLSAGGGTGLAEAFAAAEYLFNGGYSSSVFSNGANSVSIGNLFNFNDEHEMGNRQLSLIANNFQFRTLAALLSEFRTAMGSNWTNTVVFVSAEYGRAPRSDQTGTDHNPGANSALIFGGAVPGPQIIGNMKTDSGNGLYMGTYGTAGITQTSVGPILFDHGSIIATLAKIVGVESPSNSPAMIDAAFRSIAERIRNV